VLTPNRLWREFCYCKLLCDAGGRLYIIAKSLRFAGGSERIDLAKDMGIVPVSPETTEIVNGVTVFEYVRYNGMRFQTGSYTFDCRGGEQKETGGSSKGDK